MSEYFAARMMNAMIGAVKYGVRDLRNSDLTPFFDGPQIPASEVTAAVSAAQAIQRRAETEVISRSSFADQAGKPSRRFFLEYVQAAGLELTYSQELFESDDATREPQSAFLSSFLEERGGARSIPVSAEGIAADGSTTGMVQHLAQPEVPLIADADAYVRPKIRNMRQYINRYLKPR